MLNSFMEMESGDDCAIRFVFKEVCISLGENISFFLIERTNKMQPYSRIYCSSVS